MYTCLQNKNILLIGATKGIGLAIARRLHFEKANLLISYRKDEAAAKENIDSIKSNNHPIYTFKGDVLRKNATDTYVNKTKEIFPHINAIVFAIAFGKLERLSKIKSKHLHTNLQASCFFLLDLIQKLRDSFLENEAKKILCISSQGARSVIENYDSMGITKATLESVVRHLAVDLGKEDFRINAICPPPVPTESSLKIPNFKNRLKDFKKKCPIPNGISLDDIANVATFLLSNQSMGINGQILTIDGGTYQQA